MQQAIKDYLDKNRETHLDQLKTFLSLPSVSSLSEHKEDIRKTAGWVMDTLSEAGLENIELIETDRHPIVYADWLHAEDKPTVLVYGHYDVQPVDPLELWESQPFEPEVRNEKIFARGATDDKGQVFMHFKVLEAILKETGELPVNVKLIIEGEEEIGSPSMPSFVEKYKEKLAADLLLVSDTSMVADGKPAICYGLRGLCGMQIDLKGPKSDLHSGLFGGAVQNTAHALVELLGTMHDKNGKITVEGFYDNVRKLSAEEADTFEQLSNDEQLKQDVGVEELFGEAGYSSTARLWARPTLEINGIYSGFQGEGIKTVLPSEAHAKITCRLVPDQTPEEIASLIQKHIDYHLPKGVKAETTLFDQANPFITPYDHPAIQAAGEAFEKEYDEKTTYTRMGGSIPVVETFNTTLDLPCVLMGFGLPGENFHAPNEHFHLKNFDKGMRALVDYLYTLPEKL